MNEKLPEKLIPLEINVDQWRRDVKTFAETTIEALDAIVSQLSNSCSGGANDDRRTAPVSEVRTDVATNDARNDDRLAKIKSQLASRISKSSKG